MSLGKREREKMEQEHVILRLIVFFSIDLDVNPDAFQGDSYNVTLLARN